MASGLLQPPPLPSDSSPVDRHDDQVINERLRRTERQVRLVDLTAGLAGWSTAFLAALFSLALIDHWLWPLGTAGRWLALAGLIGGTLWYFATKLLPPLVKRMNRAFAAKVIEEGRPELKNSLLNYLLLRDRPAEASAVVVDALRTRAADDLSQSVVETPIDHTAAIRVGYALAGVMTIFALYKIVSPKDPFQTIARVMRPWSEIARPSRVRIESVTPGETEVYLGAVVPITCEIHGARSNENVRVVYSSLDRRTVNAEIPMQSSGGILFRAAVPAASGEGPPGLRQEIVYRIAAGDAESRSYHIRLKTAPQFNLEHVELDYPAYTNKAKAKSAEKAGDIKAIEGTKVTIHARASIPIASATVEFNTGTGGESRPPELLPMQFEGDRATARFTLTRHEDGTPRFTSYRLRFAGSNGEKNEAPPVYSIDTTADLPPEIEILKPETRRANCALDGSIPFEIRGRDPDFALFKLELKYSVRGRELKTVTLLDRPAGHVGPFNGKTILQPLELGVQPGDELLVQASAYDNRKTSDGARNPQRTDSEPCLVTITPPKGARTNNAKNGNEQDDASETPGEKSKSKNGDRSASKNGNGDSKSDETKDGGNSEKGKNGENASEKKNDSGNKKNESGENGEKGNEAGENGGKQGQPQGAGEQPEGEGKSNEKEQGASGEANGGEQTSGDNGGAGTKGRGQESGTRSGNQSGAGDQADDGSSEPGESGSSASGTEAGGDPNGRMSDTGDRGGQSRAKHDGEVFEETLKHLKEQKGGVGSRPDQPVPPGEKPPQTDAEGEGTPTNQRPEGTPGKGAPKHRPEGDPSGGGAASQPGGQGNDSKSPAEQAASERSPTPQSKSGSPKNAQQPEKGKEGGRGDAGNTQSERKSSDPSATGVPQERATDPQGKSNDDRDTQSPEQSGPSPSEKRSQSQGENSGDRSGQGKKGAGQSSGAKGKDGPGSAQASDQGGNPSPNELGNGETSQQGGNQQQSAQGGSPGEKAGPGMSDPNRSEQQKPGGNAAGKQGGNQKSQGGEAGTQTSPQNGTSGGKGSLNGGGAKGEAEASGTNAPPEQTSAEDAAYARKATDLALQHLSEQQDQPDPELLKRLGWTADDLRAFVKKWETLKREANEDETARRELNESYRDLGLSPSADRKRAGGSASDNTHGLRDSGARSDPPLSYAEQFRAFRKSVGRDGKKP